MRHIVKVSSGTASAFTWHLLVEKYGKDDVVGLFADVNGEHPDNYRFLAETSYAIGGRLVKIGNDGRTIWDVFEKAKFIGNTRAAICARELKYEACLSWLRGNTDPTMTTLYLGIDYSEAKRFTGYTDVKGKWHAGLKERWEAAGFRTEAPMIDLLLDKGDALAWLASVGIEPPLLTRLEFSHANCWGGCIKAGAKQFKRLLRVLPEGYAMWEAGENRLRDVVGDHSVLRDRRGGTTKPLTLTSLREQVQAADCASPSLFDDDDRDACGCFTFDDDEEGAA